MTQYRDIAILFLRLGTAINFLSPVADRLGMWGAPGEPGVAWGNWEKFMEYAAQTNSFAPAGMVPFLAVTATALEVIFALMLIAGFKTRLAALGSCALTLMFFIAMAISFGIKAPLDYSVLVDITSAFLLATAERYKWSVDEMLKQN